MSDATIFALLGLLYRIPWLIILVACILCFRRERTRSAVTALVGVIAYLTASLGMLALKVSYIGEHITGGTLHAWQDHFHLGTLVSSLVFGIGFLLMAMRTQSERHNKALDDTAE